MGDSRGDPVSTARIASADNASQLGWRFALACAQLLALNLALFVVYRLLFVAWFAHAALAHNLPSVLLRGLRLDLVLLGWEVLVLGVPALITRHLRCRMFLGGLWVMTALNMLVGVVNLLFFRERGQHVWEMLLANLGRVSQIVVAVEPFVAIHPLQSSLVLALPVALAMVARRHVQPFAGRSYDLWANRGMLLAFTAALVLCVGAIIERIPIRARHDRTHAYTLAGSKHYMRFADYTLNQAVVNPAADFVRYYVPELFVKDAYRLEATEALAVIRDLLGLQAANERYPLLRTVRAETALGLRNVVVIQVEGLGTSVLEHRVHDGALMPYLQRLAREGLYFPNAYQSFPATNGSVFATATGLHRSFVVDGQRPFYTGHQGSLPRILGPEGYRHFFLAGFRQAITEFVTFAANHGYEAFGYEELVPRLGERADQESSGVGIFDHALFAEAAALIAATPANYTAHIMTGTSHSPWQPPQWFPAHGLPNDLRTFRYVDDSIRVFLERLRAERGDFDHTLFVLTGDHTSLTFTESLGERLRVPLIFYSTALAEQRERWADRQHTRASHVDILPTIVSLLDGEHPYAGMGRNLLGDEVVRAGIVSNARQDGYYIKDGFVLWYASHDDAAQLFAMAGEEIVPRDVAAQHVEIVERLKREYLAMCETADRLSREQRVFPPHGAALRLTAARDP